MAEYIEREALRNAVRKNAMTKYDWSEEIDVDDFEKVLAELPAAEVEPVRPELRKAVKLLMKNYDRGLNSDYVRNPVAWALYQTWREMDGGADNS